MTSRVPSLRSGIEWLTLFLATPTIWYLHFWVVYLLAEVGCDVATHTSEQPAWLVVSTLLLTAVAVALIAWSTIAAWRRWRRGENHGRFDLYFIGVILGPLFAFSTLVVGVPVAFLPPC